MLIDDGLGRGGLASAGEGEDALAWLRLWKERVPATEGVTAAAHQPVKVGEDRWPAALPALAAGEGCMHPAGLRAIVRVATEDRECEGKAGNQTC